MDLIYPIFATKSSHTASSKITASYGGNNNDNPILFYNNTSNPINEINDVMNRLTGGSETGLSSTPLINVISTNYSENLSDTIHIGLADL